MAKAVFDSIYVAPDPRPYFNALGNGLDYRIPDYGARVFRPIVDQIRERREPDEVTVADLCCSYGLIGALLKYDVTYDDLVSHYADEDVVGLDRDELLTRDRTWLASRTRTASLRVVGLDTSEPAITYASDAGFIDHGAAENLEDTDPSPTLSDALGSTDLVTVTGGIGYITESTIGRVIDATTDDTPWIAALSLRWIDFAPIADAASDHGLATERLDHVTFPQRRFASDEEQQYVLDELDRMGIDPAGREADGYHHADLYLLRPEDEQQTPLDQIVPDEVGVRSDPATA